MRRVGDDRDVEVVDAEVRHGRLRERDVAEVRRVESAAEDADYCHSERLLADLDLLALAGAGSLEHRLELVALRALTDDPEAAVGAVDPVRPARGRLRPVLEELRQLGRLLEDGLGRGRAEPEERELQLVDAGPVAQETGKTSTTRSSSSGNVGSSGSRSILFRTIACGRSSRPAP